MAWSDPKTFSEGEILYASDLNKYYRDNMLLNEANVARTKNSYLTVDTEGDLTERTFSHQRIDNGENIGSSSYVPIGGGLYRAYTGPVDLGTPGPEVSCEVNTSCVILYSGTVKSGANDEFGLSEAIGVDIPTSSFRLQADFGDSPIAGQLQQFGQIKGTGPNYTGMLYVTGLTPGVHTFRLMYTLPLPTVGAGGVPEFTPTQATYSNRAILVIPL